MGRCPEPVIPSKKNRDRFMFCPLRTNMDWCIGQPFGSAVVPDVYIMMQGSSPQCFKDASIS